MVEALEETVRRGGKPFLGICVGMQLMAERGLEYVTTAGLGWIPGDVTLIEPSDPALKIPHMGWNTLDVAREHALLDGIPTGPPACTPISCTPTISAARDPDDVVARTRLWRAGHGHRRAATTWPARSSTPRRARSSGSP